MLAIRTVGRTPTNGYRHMVSVSSLVAVTDQIDAVGIHGAFVYQAMRVAVGGLAYFDTQEYTLLNIILGSGKQVGI